VRLTSEYPQQLQSSPPAHFYQLTDPGYPRHPYRRRGLASHETQQNETLIHDSLPCDHDCLLNVPSCIHSRKTDGEALPQTCRQLLKKTIAHMNHNNTTEQASQSIYIGNNQSDSRPRAKGPSSCQSTLAGSCPAPETKPAFKYHLDSQHSRYLPTDEPNGPEINNRNVSASPFFQASVSNVPFSVNLSLCVLCINIRPGSPGARIEY